jgi:hypothetical protein
MNNDWKLLPEIKLAESILDAGFKDLYLAEYMPDGTLKKKELKEKTPKDFIHNFLNEYNDTYCTVDSLRPSVIDTPPSKWRSIGDIYYITQHYFPKCTFIDLMEILIQIEDLIGHFCNNIDKFVVLRNTKIFKKKHSYHFWAVETTDLDMNVFNYPWETTFGMASNYQEQGVCAINFITGEITPA